MASPVMAPNGHYYELSCLDPFIPSDHVLLEEIDV
jgi:hypothetical protein